MLDGKYDTIVAGMSITDERDEVIDFTQPYIPPSWSVYVALAGDVDEAANGKVAAQVAAIQASYLMSQTGVTLLEYKLASAPVEAVLSGEADVALVDREFAHESMAEYEGRLTIVGPEVKLDFGTGVGVREDDGPSKDKLDKAISEMKDDGSLNALIKKWLGHDANPFLRPPVADAPPFWQGCKFAAYTGQRTELAAPGGSGSADLREVRGEQGQPTSQRVLVPDV